MMAVPERFQIFSQPARSILSPTSGFIRQAGFTHSLTPARNCTFGCVYCYVPTMGIYGGLKPDDWRRWGQFTTFKENAAALLRKALRPDQRIYCSPLVDPYQPAEASVQLMPGILQALLDTPPLVVAFQTRSPLILRDLGLLQALSRKTTVRVSFSVTTDRDDIRRLYEPHCAPIPVRNEAIQQLQAKGIVTHTTLAPILPCDPETLVDLALNASPNDIVADPLHLRATKQHGATTREQAFRIAEHHGHQQWFQPHFQAQLVRTMESRARQAGRRLATGPEAFAWLALPLSTSPNYSNG
jgi:DNA repair photolyase